jgi:xanthine dehydrogenase YagR molybdenum-binding subunit
MNVAEEKVSSVIGTAVPRIDGPEKVSGRAKYASDHNFPGMLYAVPVCSTVAKGKITKLHTHIADSMPGVVAIFHHGNIGELYRVAPGAGMEAMIDERRPPFEDEEVRYFGQYVAAVVAKTFEQAQAAASAVHVTYSGETPDVSTHLTSPGKAEAREQTR